jgi:flagellar protein FlbD
MDAVILVTRLNGPEFALNPDLIERAESTPDTVITLTDGTKYVVAESVPLLIALIRDCRAAVLARARLMEDDYEPPAPPPAPRPLRGL